MPGESFPVPAENPEEEQKEELPAAGKSRRKFLKMAGTAIGGLAVTGSMGESIGAAKNRKEEGGKEFSWPELNREIDEIKKGHPEKWPQEIRQRIERGIDKYFQIVAQEFLQKQRAEGELPQWLPQPIRKDLEMVRGNMPPGLVEGVVIGLFHDWLKKLEQGGSRPLISLDNANKILLFGSAGAGTGLLLEKLETLLREKNPSIGLQRMKQHTIDLAFRALSLNEDENMAPKTLSAFEDLADTITQNLADYHEYLKEAMAPKTMLEYWGAGAAIIPLPTGKILERRLVDANRGV